MNEGGQVSVDWIDWKKLVSVKLIRISGSLRIVDELNGCIVLLGC